jgi:hypothetical protein
MAASMALPFLANSSLWMSHNWHCSLIRASGTQLIVNFVVLLSKDSALRRVGGDGRIAIELNGRVADVVAQVRAFTQQILGQVELVEDEAAKQRQGHSDYDDVSSVGVERKCTKS